MRRHATLPIVAALALGALLTGCSADDDEDDVVAMPFDTVAMPVDRAPTATPGQHLAQGEIALLPQTDFAGVPDIEIETTVIGVAEGDASYWDTFDNGADFAGETPFFAVMQYRWVTGDVDAYSNPILRPILEDGTEGGMVQRETGPIMSDTACPFEVGRFDMDPDRGDNEYIACVVYTAPEGSTIVGLGWNNVSSSFLSEPAPELNPFYATPVVWDVTPVAAPNSTDN